MAYPSSISAALTLAVATLLIESLQDAAVVAFTKHGTAIPLSTEAQSQVAERVRALMVGCAITSVSDPGIFSDRVLAREWLEVRAHSHLYVRFPRPLQAQRSSLQMSEVAIGFEDGSFIGPELTRHGGEVVGHVKCDGLRALALMCGPGLRPHLLAGQERNCSVYDRMGDRR